MNPELVEAVRDHWGWTGIAPIAVTAVSPFGHLIIKDEASAFWYLDPELREVQQVASDEPALFRYMSDDEVRLTWQAAALVEAARERLGDPSPGRCYSLIPHALLAGDYAAANLCILPVVEVVSWTGDVARQTKDLPEGASFRMTVTD